MNVEEPLLRQHSDQSQQKLEAEMEQKTKTMAHYLSKLSHGGPSELRRREAKEDHWD